MPFTLTTPDEKTTNTVRVEAYEVRGINVAGGPYVSVTYSQGNTTGEVYTVYETKTVELTPASVTTKMSAAQAADSTIYGTVKQALYDILEDDGHVEAGTVG
jgi:hypothetical protein